MDRETVIIGLGVRKSELRCGNQLTVNPKAAYAPSDELQVKVPEVLRPGFQDFKHFIPEILIEGGAFIGGVKGALSAQNPGSGIIHKHILDIPGASVHHRHLQHLDALRAQDIAAVAVTLLLITLAGLD